MSLGVALALRGEIMQLYRARIDAGTGAGRLRIYAGARPATGGTPTTLLAEFVLSDPCGTVSGATLTFGPAADVDAVADGDASWARFVDSDGAFVMDAGAGAPDTAAEVWLSETALTAGRTLEFVSGVLTEGNP